MKIDILVQNYPPETGAVHYTSELAAFLAVSGHKVKVVTALPHYPTGKPHKQYGRFPSQRKIEHGVDVLRMPIIMARNDQLLKRIFGFFSFMVTGFWGLLSDKKPDILLVSIPSMFIWPAGLLFARLHRIPVVLLLRDVEPLISFEIRGVEKMLWARMAIKLSLWAYSFADYLVFVHPAQLNAFHGYNLTGRAGVINHGIDFKRFDKQSEIVIPELPGRPGTKRAVYTGTVGVAQDLVPLIRSFSSTEIGSMLIDLIIVGTGECIDDCRQVARKSKYNNVYFIDPVPLEEVPAILKVADLMIMSYHDRGRSIDGMIGSKFYEYCAAGKPVLVHGPGMAVDLVENEIGNGWYCPVNDISKLQKTLQSFLDDKACGGLIGKLGRDYAEANYSKQERYQKWEQILLSLINNS